MMNPFPVNLLTSAEVRGRGWQAESRDADGHLISCHAPIDADDSSIAEWIVECTSRGETVTFWPVNSGVLQQFAEPVETPPPSSHVVPDEDAVETVARRIYEDAHKGMSNIWSWNDRGLDDEHPGTRERYLGYARSAIAATPPPVRHVARVGWATVRVEDTCDGLMINAEDMKRFGLQYDVHYEGHFLPDGRYRIAIPSPAPKKPLRGEVTHEDICNTHEGGPCNCDWSAAGQSPKTPISVLVKEAIEAVWKCSLIIESSVRRCDGPMQYAEVLYALSLVKEVRAALATTEGSEG